MIFNQVEKVQIIRESVRKGESISKICKRFGLSQPSLYSLLRSYYHRPDKTKCNCGLPATHTEPCLKTVQDKISLREFLTIRDDDTQKQKDYKILYKYYIFYMQEEGNIYSVSYVRFCNYRIKFINTYGLNEFNAALLNVVVSVEGQISFLDRSHVDGDYETKIRLILQRIDLKENNISAPMVDDDEDNITTPAWIDLLPPKRIRKKTKELEPVV